MVLTMLPLTVEQAARAYPLVREIPGAGSLQDWMRFVKELTSGAEGEAGVMVCEGDKYIRGLFGWRVCRDLACRRELQIKHFAAFGMLSARHVIDTMLDAVDVLADNLGCHHVMIEAPVGSPHVAAFTEKGHTVTAVGMRRRVDGDNSEATTTANE